MDEPTRSADLRLEQELNQLAGPGPVLAPGPGADVLAVRGGDPLEALHRVVSQDLRAIPHGGSALALLLAPKGQVRGMMVVFPRDEEVLLLAPPGSGEDLTASLNRYLMLSRCRVESVAPSRLICVLGEGWRRLAGGGDGDLVLEGSGDDEVWWFGRTVAGMPGAVVAALGGMGARRVGELTAGLPRISQDTAELVRIGRGLPAWGREVTEITLPPEVGLELAVSLSKGCYVGQEVMARIDAYGRVNRTLVGVLRQDGPEDVPSVPLELAPTPGDRPRGQLTSAAYHPEHGLVGLAVVRREVSVPGADLFGDGRRFRVTALPLWEAATSSV